MSVLKLKITTKRPNNYLSSTFQTAGGVRAIAERLKQYIERVATGNELAQDTATPPGINVVVQGNEVYASGTIAFSGAATANDTVLINGVTFTAVASGATGNQWNVGVTATATAANLAAAINASATALVNTQVVATAATGTLTVTAALPSYAGNAVTLAKGTDSGSVMTVSGARLTGGLPDAGALTLNF